MLETKNPIRHRGVTCETLPPNVINTNNILNETTMTNVITGTYPNSLTFPNTVAKVR